MVMHVLTGVQLPPAQASLGPHTVPQVPQLSGSKLVFVHAAPQRV
jgi:hypothetical protein